MSKGSSKKGSKKPAEPSLADRAQRLEKALAAGLKREAKAASRLETAQLEVAVLRIALAELVGEATDAPSVLVVEVAGPPAPKPPAAKPAAAKPAVKPAAAKPAAKPAAAKPAAAKPAAKPAAAKPAAKPAATPRATRPRPGTGAPDR
jgi:hypothetical protein